MSEITYTHVGDYLLPDLRLPEQEGAPIGKYGLLRRTYLKTHKRISYLSLLTEGELHKHLAEIDAQASNMLDCLMRQMAAVQGVTEALKVADQMAWVGAMNNIKACAEEIVFNEIIYI